MSRSTDDPNIDGVVGIFAFAALVASSGASYFRDLYASVERLFGGDGLEAAMRDEQLRIEAQLLALAAIADGLITEAEHPIIAEFARRHQFSAEEVLTKVSLLAERFRDRDVFREKVAHCAAQLHPERRLAIFAAVKKMAQRGSRAWPEPHGYRAAGPTPEALVETFRDALGIGATTDE